MVLLWWRGWEPSQTGLKAAAELIRGLFAAEDVDKPFYVASTGKKLGVDFVKELERLVPGLRERGCTIVDADMSDIVERAAAPGPEGEALRGAVIEEEKKKATRDFLNETAETEDAPLMYVATYTLGPGVSNRGKKLATVVLIGKGKSLTPEMIIQACLRCRDTEVLIFIFIGAPGEELVRVLVKEQVDFSSLSAAQREYVEDRIVSSESAAKGLEILRCATRQAEHGGLPKVRAGDKEVVFDGGAYFSLLPAGTLPCIRLLGTGGRVARRKCFMVVSPLATCSTSGRPST